MTSLARKSVDLPATDASPASGSTFTVRTASAADLPAVRELLGAAALPTADIEAQFGPAYAVAVSGDGHVIGAEGIEVYGGNGSPMYGLLRSAVVAASWRGRGVGEALTRNRLQWSRDEGLAAVFLLTTTAATWFPKFGFEEIGRSEVPAAVLAATEFVSACPASATVMRLADGRAPSGV